MNTASLFPMFLKLEGRSCLVLGAGSVGEQKIRSLLDCGAKICVVAPSASPAVMEWANRGALTWLQRPFESADLDGVFLVVAATSSIEVNHAIYREAQARRILCNVVDDPPHCDFYYPAVVRRGQLQIAISTAGLSPALAQRIRKQLEEEFPPAYASWLEELGSRRESLFRAGGDPERRRRLLHRLATPEGFLESERSNQSESGKEVL
ncbi:MAG: bifunctional precorrin-2 dehydrogenase/sirohydrochlorin ferrochelatase [Terriglobales bacterium]